MAKTQNDHGLEPQAPHPSAATGNAEPATTRQWGGGGGGQPRTKIKTTYNPLIIEHVISDDELGRLSQEGGGLGNWFYCLFGAFLGSIPSFIDRIQKIGSDQTPLDGWDLIILALSFGCLVAAVCVGVIRHGRTTDSKMLTDQIRSRKAIARHK